MSKRVLILVLVLLVAIGSGFIVRRTLVNRAKAAKVESDILKGLTAADINLVLMSQAGTDASSVAAITANVETRRAFLNGLREHLALAAQAKREGLSEDPNFKINLEYKKNILLAELYLARLRKEQQQYSVTKAELDAVWTNRQSENQFNKDMQAILEIQNGVAKARGNQQSFTRPKGEALIKSRDKWARTQVLSSKAKQDVAFMARPEIQLRFKVLETVILSAGYLRQHWVGSIKATHQDIAAYLAAHPEYDLNRKREKARAILKRARAGEDLARLASEFSEDRSTKDKGGLFQDVGKGTIWVEVETAALVLNQGEVAESLIESDIGYHIVKLEKKTIKRKEDGTEAGTFSVRHILLQKSFEEPGSRQPGIPPPFMKAEEIARAQVEKEKRDKFVAGLVQRSQINLPEDFTLDLSQALPAKPSPNPVSTENSTSH